MRTLRAALASTTPLGLHPACATSPEISVRMAETAVRHQPKSLYGFNRFACTTPAETTVRFRPFYTLDVIVAHLERRQVLLVLDNCEHLVKACAELADTLLHGCPGVHLLATSREALHIPGERAWRVPSLAIPDLHSIVRPEELTRFAAAQLFVERAQAVQSNFAV